MRDAVRTVGRYELAGELGRGAMAVVYRARQIDLDREVALKELRGGDPALMRRFLQEARFAGSLSHPNVVTVYELFEHGGCAYIAMELVEGGSLRPYMEELGLAQMVGVLAGMLAGLGSCTGTSSPRTF